MNAGTSAGDPSLQKVVDILWTRVGRIEAHLGLTDVPVMELAPESVVRPQAAGSATATKPVKPEPFEAEGWATTPVLPAEVFRATAKALPPHMRGRTEPTAPRPVRSAPRPAPPPIPAPKVIPAYEPADSSDEAPRQSALEQTIGLKWSGWVGAVVVVIGVALGIKYAYDQKWFEILPPAGRLALMSLAAFALIGAGEVVYRRIHRFAAACLYGAGVASLFLVSYAGFGYYRLYEQQTAFLLMALSTVAGAAVAMRGRFVSIAVLAQIGGNLAPVLLHSDHPRLTPFLAYLLTLQLVALTLAWWGGVAKWWTLRVVSLATTGFWMLGVLTSGSFAGSPAVKLTFCLLFAALFQAELILSAIRASAGRFAAAAAPPDEAIFVPAEKRGITFSMVVTALLTAALLFVLRDASHLARGLWVLALSGTCAGLGMLVRHPAHEARRNLSIGYRIQAAALLVVAVPAALAGVWIVIGWAVLALAFAAVGKALDLPLARRAGIWVWRLATLYLAWWTIDPIHTAHRAAANQQWLRLLGAGVPAYAVVAWLLALGGHAIAWMVRPVGSGRDDDAASETLADRQFERRAWLMNGSAALVWIAAAVAALPPAGATLAILVYAWLLLGADVARPRLGLSVQSAGVVGVAIIKWMAVDTLAERLARDWSATARTPVFNAVMGVGLLLSATMAALYWLRRDALWAAMAQHPLDPDELEPGAARVSPAAPAIALAALVGVVMTFGFSFEIDRLVEAAAPGAIAWPAAQFKQMSWTVLWTISAGAFLALARLLEPVDRLRPGWVRGAEKLALALAVKYLLVDTLMFRLGHRPPLTAAVVNFQSFTALVVVGGMALASYLMTRGQGDNQPGDGRAERARAVLRMAGFLGVLVVLWAGTLEIDRAFEQMIAAGSTGVFRDPRLAKQVAFSIFWSLFAVSAVVAGFRFRTAGLRYFGLGLFAVTVLKVVLLDMSQVQTGYRVLSFLGLGLLLMGTSVLYGKLSPVLLRDREMVT